MAFQTVIVYHSAESGDVPGLVGRFARDQGLQVARTHSSEDLMARINRGFPACVVMSAKGAGAEAIELCRTLKGDTFSAIVPVIFLGDALEPDQVEAGLEAGADEILTAGMDDRERLLRLRVTLQRADRDVSVNPTTRLPGTVQIQRDISERLGRNELFAVCYADIDHFKEFNDRYGYTRGDRIILILSRILRDVVKAHAPGGFIGHIGGDDFIFNVPLDLMPGCCAEVLEIFDEIIPFQYGPEDRQRGYFLAKDRRGSVHRIPLMSLSIGVVTNEFRVFTHTARVSELASEMKSYAKSIPGSVYQVDRRRDPALRDETVPEADTAGRTQMNES